MTQNYIHQNNKAKKKSKMFSKIPNKNLSTAKFIKNSLRFNF